MANTTKVAKVGIKKEPGYLYFIDKDGDISKVKKALKWEPTIKPNEGISLLYDWIKENRHIFSF